MLKRLFRFMFKKDLESIKHNEFKKYTLIIDNIDIIKGLLFIVRENTWDKDKIDEIYDRVNYIKQTLNEICLDNNKFI